MKYTLEQYKNLSRFENHKIKYDGYDYWWYSKKGDEFTIHCIQPFYNVKMLLSNIYFWISKYHTMSISNDEYLDIMLKELFLDVKIKEISNNKTIKNKDKIKQILTIKPHIKPKELVDLLEVTKMAISKHLKAYKAL